LLPAPVRLFSNREHYMKKIAGHAITPHDGPLKADWLKLAGAVIIYAGFAFYLYHPYLANFSTVRYMLVFNAVAGALGCFVLSRRWVNVFPAPFFAGLVYGFGSLALGLGIYHPLTGLLIAIVPWLFCPVAFWPRRGSWLRAIISVLFFVLPFFLVVLLFWISSKQGLFPIPRQAKLHLSDLCGLVVPLATRGGRFVFVGFYHVPLAALMMGLFMFFAVHRLWPMVVFAIGLVLAFCDSILSVSPIIWAALPVLCCSILVGTGMQGLVSATTADKKWVLICGVIMAVITLTTLAFAMGLQIRLFKFGPAVEAAKLLVVSAKMSAMGTLAVAIIFFIIRAKLRAHWLRWIILCAAAGIDILISAPIIIDKIF